jgi:hypothetical protein
VLTIPDDRQVCLEIAYPGYENATLIAPLGGTAFPVGLRMAGGLNLENTQLLIETSKPGVSESKTGRNVAISGEDLTRTAEIGIIEDVMTSMKLLSGVGYIGMFNAKPLIRGGEPGDLIAIFESFYLENPDHWGGGICILIHGWPRAHRFRTASLESRSQEVMNAQDIHFINIPKTRNQS